ncbi:hypothetical protein [Methanosarcina sp.]|uniref:hypothetical protein n=1 Tax=Methanosarcina sp. TaxID=2213 RepID=UPI003C709331
MIKSGTLKPALLLALIAVIVIALVEPIAGDMMGQGNMMNQRSTVIVCPDNQTCSIKLSGIGDRPANDTMTSYMMGHHCIMGNLSANETMMQCMIGNQSMNDTMMRCMMGNDSMNGTMMHCMMGNDSLNDTMMHHCMHHCMHCMMGNDSMNGTMMHCMMGNDSMNDTMMHCMMGNDSMMNGTCCMMGMDTNASAAQARLACARFWLEQAIEMHEMHLKDPSTATNESQLEMMDQMMMAYECIAGENMTGNMTEHMSM